MSGHASRHRCGTFRHGGQGLETTHSVQTSLPASSCKHGKVSIRLHLINHILGHMLDMTSEGASELPNEGSLA